VLKVLLDTSVVNWLVDNPPAAHAFFRGRDERLFETMVTPEAATEVRDTKNPDRLTSSSRCSVASFHSRPPE
jgi:hypothetical protein